MTKDIREKENARFTTCVPLLFNPIKKQILRFSLNNLPYREISLIFMTEYLLYQHRCPD